jgi:poly(hydroxyalkanoate) granule-associated protein
MASKNGTNGTNGTIIEDAVETTAAAVSSTADAVAEQVEAAEKKARKVVKNVADQAADVVETVEVKVNEAMNNAGASSAWLVDGFRRIVLASIGAVAMSIDEAEVLIGKLVERGELAQKDGQKLLKDMQGRVANGRVGTPSVASVQVERVGERVTDRIEQGVEEVLGRLNIPSKRDIDDLSAKIAQLTARVEELKKK